MDDEKVKLFFSDYLDCKVLKFYLTHIFEALEEWYDVQSTIVQRFGIVSGDPLQELFHYRQKQTQSVKT